jgi:plastocyanin
VRAQRGAVPLFMALAGLGWSLLAVDRASAASNLVRITSTLEPAIMTIAPGDAITWRNDDTQRHRMRSTSGPTEFDSGDLDPGESYTIMLSALGTYRYRDERDRDLSNYWGTIAVAPPSSSPSPGATGDPGAPPAPSDATIRMAGRAFTPSSVTITVGGRVTWLNDDSRDHTASSSSNVFESGLMAPGATFVRTFTAAGTFSYLCLIHPDMTGSVVVTGLPGTTPPPATPTPAPTTAPPAAAGDVEIVDFAFIPGDFTIDAGTRVTFANHGAALHTVTATDGSFDSGLMRANGTYERVFATPGTFPFLCALHPTMTGTIRVRGAAGATPPPQPIPTPAAALPPGGVRIVDFAFLPSQLRVPLGSTITWVNSGVAPHTVTGRGGEFDSGLMAPRATFRRTFSSPGTFAYLCAIHPDMTGTVLVAGPDGSVPPPSPTRQPPPLASAQPGVTDVRVVDLAFDPAVVNIPVGGTIRFTNLGAAIHTATALDGSFDSGFLATNEAWEHVFGASAIVDYVCALHPSMVGTIIVGGTDGGSGGTPGSGGTSGSDGTPTPSAGDVTGPAPAGGISPGSAAGPDQNGADVEGVAGGRSPISIAIGLVLLLAAIAGGLAVVRGVGRRATGAA